MDFKKIYTQSSLNELTGIESINGDLKLYGSKETAKHDPNDVINDFTPLENLKTIEGGFIIHNCANIKDIQLPNLEKVNGSFELHGNMQLEQINLPTLKSVEGELSFQRNIRLKNIYGCVNMSQVGALIFHENFKLERIGFPTLSNITGKKRKRADGNDFSVSITQNSALKDFVLPKLEKVDNGQLIITNNPKLNLCQLVPFTEDKIIESEKVTIFSTEGYNNASEFSKLANRCSNNDRSKTRAFGPTAYILNHRDCRVNVLDLETDLVVASINLGDNNFPSCIAFTDEKDFAIVGTEGKGKSGSVIIIKTATNRVVGNIDIPGPPFSIDVSYGKIYVTTTKPNKIIVFSKDGFYKERSIELENKKPLATTAGEVGFVIVYQEPSKGAVLNVYGSHSKKDIELPLGKDVSVKHLFAGPVEQALYLILDSLKGVAGAGLQVVALDLASKSASLGQKKELGFKLNSFAIDPDENNFYVSGKDAINIFDKYAKLTESIPIQSEYEDSRIFAISQSTGKLYVRTRQEGVIAVYGLKDKKLINTIELDGGISTINIVSEIPQAPVIDLDPHAFVPGERGLSIVNANSKSIIEVGNLSKLQPHEKNGIVISPHNKKVFFAGKGRSNISVIELEKGTRSAISLQDPKYYYSPYDPRICTSASNNSVYVLGSYMAPSGVIFTIDTNNNSLSSTIKTSVHRLDKIHSIQHIELLGNSNYFIFSEHGNNGQVSQKIKFLFFDEKTQAIAKEYECDKQPSAILIKQKDNTSFVLYIAFTDSNSVDVINVDKVEDILKIKKLKTIQVGKKPVGLTWNIEKTKIFVNHEDSEYVKVINVPNNELDSLRLHAGKFQSGLSYTPDGKEIYVVKTKENAIKVFNNFTGELKAIIPVGKKPAVYGNFVTGAEQRAYLMEEMENDSEKAYYLRTYTFNDNNIKENFVRLPYGSGGDEYDLITSPLGTEVYIRIDDIIYVVDVLSNRLVKRFVFNDGINKIDISLNGFFLYVLFDDRNGKHKISTIDLRNKSTIETVDLHLNIEQRVEDMAISADGELMHMVVSDQGEIKATTTKLSSGDKIGEYIDCNCTNAHVISSPDFEHFYVITNNNDILKFNTSNEQLGIHSIGQFNDIKIGPSGDIIYVINGSTLALLDITDFDKVVRSEYKYPSNSTYLNTIVVSPDSNLIYLTANDPDHSVSAFPIFDDAQKKFLNSESKLYRKILAPRRNSSNANSFVLFR